MYKTFLFLTAFLVSAGANAAALTIETAGLFTSPVTIANNNTDSATASGNFDFFSSSTFIFNTNEQTAVNIDFNVTGAGLLSFGAANSDGQLIEFLPSQTFIDVSDNFFVTTLLSPGTPLAFIFQDLSGGGAFDLTIASISEVPVPAALLLFAPALIGFLGLRRKAAKSAAESVAA